MTEDSSATPPATDQDYPAVLRVAGRHCLVVGGGTVAARRAARLVAAGAAVTVVAPHVDTSIDDMATTRPVAPDTPAGGGTLEVVRRPYEQGEAAGFFLVVTATDRPEVNAAVVADAHSAGVLAATANQDDRASLRLPAVRRRGPVTVAVSTGGSTPALSRWLADRMASVVPEGVEALVSLLEEARAALREAGRPTDSVPWSDLLDHTLVPLVEAGRIDEARARLLALCRPEGPAATSV
jgi:siroheme synthase-like protein